MPNPDLRLVRGLSIVVIVVSGLALVGCLLLLVLLVVGGAVLNDPSTIAAVQSDPALAGALGPSRSSEALAAFLAITLGFIVALGVWLVVCHVAVLVAGIIGLRASSDPEKLGAAFGWAIAGAVLSLLCCNLVTMALLIISAVYLNRLRTAPSQPQPPVPPYQP